ncbi:conserved hypothetical protein [metagenome]|uniref:(S)-ureidoglycine aminohydrolase cupin domain-containing protein n=1 Tax=metagenome TaxID=256318 RepID=A0A2P2CDR3_9ZZZZ
MPTSGRVLNRAVFTDPLSHEELAADDVVQGRPTTGSTAVGSVAGAEVGIWEMTVGAARDTEVDEVFIVLSGRGSVHFEDGESIDLSPGVAVRLSAGERTEWLVQETLRKVYVAAE